LLNNKISSFDKRYTTNKMSVRFGDEMCKEDTLLGMD
jgi:hypothetical protein